MSETLIKVEGVSKKFCRSLKRSLFYGLQDLGREITGRRHGGDSGLRSDEFWAVRDISFELKRGECLGLIGHNGAGKTTLLKMLNGLIKPDSGRIEIRGRVGALIALGAGFNPILTGRENIYINASLLGLSKVEIESQLDEIIDFAEIGEFIDMPVQNYSSGMTVRLGFAVASSLKPDVLLLDEVMAVGDMAFVLKCFNRMDRLIKDTAVIFVSHGMPQVSRVATDVLVMERGISVCQGRGTAEGIDKYYEMIKPVPAFSVGENYSVAEISINSQLFSGDPVRLNRLDDMQIACKLQADVRSKELGLYLAFYDAEQRGIAEFTEDVPTKIKNLTGTIEFEVHVPAVNFSKGVYSITVGLIDLATNEMVLRAQSAAYFQIIATRTMWTAFQLHGTLTQTSV